MKYLIFKYLFDQVMWYDHNVLSALTVTLLNIKEYNFYNC